MPELDLNNPVFWKDHVFVQFAYDNGYNAINGSKNPYTYNSSNWFSWNKGNNTKKWNKNVTTDKNNLFSFQ